MQLLDKLKASPYISLHCDESTDVTKAHSYLCLSGYVDENIIREELLFCHALLRSTKGADVMKTIDDYIQENGLLWQNLVGFCTDGAPAMLGARSGLSAPVENKNASVITTHCFIHRQALSSKTLPKDLLAAMKKPITAVNLVK